MSELHEDVRDVATQIDAVAAELEELAPEPMLSETLRKSEALQSLAKVRALRLAVDERLRQIELEAAQEAFRETARWGDIAHAIGVTRQTAQATYRDRENKPRVRRPRHEPQPLNRQARRPSARDTNSWPQAMVDEWAEE